VVVESSSDEDKSSDTWDGHAPYEEEKKKGTQKTKLKNQSKYYTNYSMHPSRSSNICF